MNKCKEQYYKKIIKQLDSLFKIKKKNVICIQIYM